MRLRNFPFGPGRIHRRPFARCPHKVCGHGVTQSWDPLATISVHWSRFGIGPVQRRVADEGVNCAAIARVFTAPSSGRYSLKLAPGTGRKIVASLLGVWRSRSRRRNRPPRRSGNPALDDVERPMFVQHLGDFQLFRSWVNWSRPGDCSPSAQGGVSEDHTTWSDMFVFPLISLSGLRRGGHP